MQTARASFPDRNRRDPRPRLDRYQHGKRPEWCIKPGIEAVVKREEIADLVPRLANEAVIERD
jgi:hypothetical protein